MSQTVDDLNRRSMLNIVTGTMALGGAVAAGVPLVLQMAPDSTVQKPFELDFSGLAEGEEMMFKWRGGPYIIRHRRSADIEAARPAVVSDLHDPYARNGLLPHEALATEENRAFGPNWRYVVMAPVCTHLGCIVGTGFSEGVVERPGGFFCPCHGARYDSLGRVFEGPAKYNLPIPKYSIRAGGILVLGDLSLG